MPSVYEPEPDVDQHAQPSSENSRSWRSFIASATYSTLRSHYGDMEMQRQEVIYQFHGAQQELVQQLGAIVRVFVLPLRRRHSKAWLPGVPKEVSRLFDWLEDIMNLHTSLAETLDSVTSPWSTGEIVIHFAQAIRGFVPRLEIYQPYLVRVDAIQKMLSESAATQGDEFGEFVRLRETHEECGGWTLSELLQRPIDYLTTSIESYKVRMLATYRLQLTNASCRDYLISLRETIQTIFPQFHYTTPPARSSTFCARSKQEKRSTNSSRIFLAKSVIFNPRCNSHGENVDCFGTATFYGPLDSHLNLMVAMRFSLRDPMVARARCPPSYCPLVQTLRRYPNHRDDALPAHMMA